MWKSIFTIALLSIGRTDLANAQPASFDCRLAHSPTEIAICSDARLSELDRIGGVAFRVGKQRIDAHELVTTVQSLLLARIACRSNKLCILDNQIEGLRQYQRWNLPVDIPEWLPQYRAELNGNYAKGVFKFQCWPDDSISDRALDPISTIIFGLSNAIFDPTHQYDGTEFFSVVHVSRELRRLVCPGGDPWRAADRPGRLQDGGRGRRLGSVEVKDVARRASRAVFLAPEAVHAFVLIYRLFKEVETAPEVQHIHREFLFARDYASFSALFLVGLGVGALVLVHSWKVTLIYCFALLLQFIVVRHVAATYGVRFVCTVLAVKSTQRPPISPGKPKTSKKAE